MIFPMSGNSTFETHAFFYGSEGALLSPTVFLWKKIIAKHDKYDFMLSF